MEADRHGELRRELARTWGEAGAPAAPEAQALAQQRLRAYRPRAWKTALAWTSVIFGVLALLGSGGSFLDEGIGYALGSVLLSAALALPGGYWLLRNREDARGIRTWLERQETHDQLSDLLTSADLELLGPRPGPPVLPKRRWGRVVAAAVLLAILGTFLLPPV